MPTPQDAFLAIIRQYQENMKVTAIDVKNLRAHEGASLMDGEVIANIMLATRHIEDAESRLGRIQ